MHRIEIQTFAIGGLGTLVFSHERSCAPSDDGVKRVRKNTARTAVEAVDVAEVSSLLEVALYEAHVAGVVEAVPDLDCLRRKAAIGEGDHYLRSCLKHPTCLAQHLYRPGQIIHRDADSRPSNLPLPNGRRGFVFRFWTAYESSLSLRRSSTSFMPSPMTRRYSTSGGRWLTQLLMRSRSSPPAGKNSLYSCVTAAMAGSSMCVTSRGVR